MELNKVSASYSEAWGHEGLPSVVWRSPTHHLLLGLGLVELLCSPQFIALTSVVGSILQKSMKQSRLAVSLQGVHKYNSFHTFCIAPQQFRSRSRSVVFKAPIVLEGLSFENQS